MSATAAAEGLRKRAAVAAAEQSEIQPDYSSEERRPGRGLRRQGSGDEDNPFGTHPALRQRGPMPLRYEVGLLLFLLAVGWTLIQVLPRLAGDKHKPITPETLWTPDELWGYRGHEGRTFLAVMGEVFDVSAGRRHYGPRGGYSFFAGRDASRSYLTGDFKNDLNDSVDDFTPEQLADLAKWRDFFRKGGKQSLYNPAGRVVGSFYDSDGAPTALLGRVEAALAAREDAKQAEQAAAAAAGGEQQQQREEGAASLTPCNVKWSKAEGGWVWCPDNKHPRRVALPDALGEVQEQCACFVEEAVARSRRMYDGCPQGASRCQTSRPEGSA